MDRCLMGVSMGTGSVRSPFAVLDSALQELRKDPDPNRRAVLEQIERHQRRRIDTEWDVLVKKYGPHCERCGKHLTAKDSIDLWMVDRLGKKCRLRVDEERAA